MLLRELIVKLFITILFNSKQNFNDDTFKNIYTKFLPNYRSLYENEKQKESEEDEEEDENNNNKININKKIKKKNNIYKEVFGIIKPYLDRGF